MWTLPNIITLVRICFTPVIALLPFIEGYWPKLIAFVIFSTHVAANIAKGVDPSVVTLGLVAVGLVGAVLWDLLTWWWALPTSSSHALLGGLAGAAVVKAGFAALDLAGTAFDVILGRFTRLDGNLVLVISGKVSARFQLLDLPAQFFGALALGFLLV